MTKSLVACVEDLFFRSKIDATARHLNVPVRFVDGRGLAGASREKGTAAALVELSASDCLDAVRQIRENESTRDLPVIVVVVLFIALLVSYPWEVLSVGTVA